MASMIDPMKTCRGPVAPVHNLSAHDRLRLAAEAAVCPATIRKFFSGGTIRSTSKARIERALRALGFSQRETRA